MIVSDTDDIPQEYAMALDAADTLRELRKVTYLFREVAMDAAVAAERMTEHDHDDWRTALQRERSGVSMGSNNLERFRNILLPNVMMQVTIIADQFQIPWGMAYNRLKDVHFLVVRNGVATMNF